MSTIEELGRIEELGVLMWSRGGWPVDGFVVVTVVSLCLAYADRCSVFHDTV